MPAAETRRRFLSNIVFAAAGLAGASAIAGGAAEPPPEVTTIRLDKLPITCIAPQYLAEELLRAEGFTDVRYVTTVPGEPSVRAITHGEIDFTTNFSPPLIIAVDAGEPITMVAGVHVGCFELFAREGIRGILDLKGKTVGVQDINSSQYAFVGGVASYVGLEPAKDIRWVTSS